MKKNKLLLLVAVLLMISTIFVGCGDNNTVNESEGETTTASSDSNDNQNEDNSEKEAFNQKVADLIDLSKYEYKDWSLEDGYGNAVEYSIKSDSAEKFDFDYVIKFGDGSSIKLPITYSEMKNTGWETETEADKQISNKVSTGVYYKNENGEKITLWTQNFDFGDEETYINLSECKFFAIDIDVNSVKQYTICDTLTEKSTMEDFIEVLGNPSTIEYSWDDDEVKLFFMEKLTNGYSHIKVFFDGEGETISSIKYEYSYLDF